MNYVDELVIKRKNSLSSKTRLHSPRAKRKRCYDVTLSRQQGSTMRHLATGKAIVHWIGCINAIVLCIGHSYGFQDIHTFSFSAKIQDGCQKW